MVLYKKLSLKYCFCKKSQTVNQETGLAILQGKSLVDGCQVKPSRGVFRKIRLKPKT